MKTNDKNLRKLNKKGAGASKTKKQTSDVFAGKALKNGEIFKRGLPSLKFPSALQAIMQNDPKRILGFF